MSESLWMALALVMVIEGLFPFISPQGWRKAFTSLLGMTDGQIRFFGLCAVLVGLIGLWMVD